MKIILTLIVCSALHQSCLDPIQRTNRFETWADCMRAGYNDSLEMMQKLGDASLNHYQTFIKFYCNDKPLEKPKTGDPA